MKAELVNKTQMIYLAVSCILKRYNFNSYLLFFAELSFVRRGEGMGIIIPQAYSLGQIASAHPLSLLCGSKA